MKACLTFLAILLGVQSQNTTRRGTVGDCPVPDASVIAALLPESFDLGDGAPRPVITISDFNIVCQSTGLTRGTIGSFSVIVAFSCTTGPAVCDESLVTNQFTYDCNEDNTFTEARNIRGEVRRTDPIGNLTTPLDTECGECVDPNNLFVVGDPDTHCGACQSVCNEGQRGCVLVSLTSSEFCCNWYLEGQCVVTCPGNLTGDTEPDTIYDCGCGPLELEFGTISYSNRFAVGSVATHTCDESYVLSANNGDSQRMCNRTTEGWTGETITCDEFYDCGSEDISRPENGQVDIMTTILGSLATFSCDDGYILVGNEERTCELEGWTGSNPTCDFDATNTTSSVDIGVAVGIPIVLLLILLILVASILLALCNTTTYP